MKTTIKSVATLAAILSISMFAGAKGQDGEGQRGERQGQKQGQKGTHECKKGDQGNTERSREDARDRFDKDGDGKLSEQERAHAKRSHKRNRNGGNKDTDV